MSAHYDPMHVTGWTRSQMVNAVPPVALATGDTRQMVPGGAFTSQAVWVSDTPGVASVNSSGLITAVGPGSAVLSVSDGANTADTDVTVT